VLDRFAARVNPLLRDELAGYRYYWATHQAEYATDVLFTSRPALRALYGRLLRHATLCLRAEDVLDFLGRKLHGGFAGEVLTEWKRRLTTPHSVSLRGRRLFIAPICAGCTVTWEEEDSCPDSHPGLPRGFGEGLGGGAPDEQRPDLR